MSERGFLNPPIVKVKMLSVSVTVFALCPLGIYINTYFEFDGVKLQVILVVTLARVYLQKFVTPVVLEIDISAGKITDT